MTTRRSILAGAAAFSASVPFASTFSPANAATGTPRQGGILRISVDQAAGVLNPLLTRVNPEYLVSELLYSGLTRLRLDMSAEPDLAESWSASTDLVTWTFKLRPGLVFHDGTPCTAKDVEASFQRMLDPKTGSAARTNCGPIKDVTATDATTVVFHLTGPYADMPVALAYTNAKVIPASLASGDMGALSHSANGTGPFKLVSFEPERKIVVERNPHYWDPNRPHVDRVEVLVYPDPTAEVSALIAGDTDLMANAQPAQFGRLKTAKGVAALRVPSGQFLNVNMACDAKPFDDMRVRQALALTVDRTAMVGFVAEGYGTPGDDTPLSPAYHFYHGLPLKQRNIPEARKLLAAAGYPNGIDLTLVASVNPGTRAQLAVAMREMAKEAGFRITVQTMPHATYLAQVWKKGHFYVGFYNMQATADAIFSLLYTSNAAWPETRWDNKDFDKLVGEARITTDEAKRTALYAQAQELMNREVPSVIPVFFDLLAGKRTYVEGYALHPRGAVFLLDKLWLGTGAPHRG
jgi:peptide/nickel transport system substrate-binding protein